VAVGVGVERPTWHTIYASNIDRQKREPCRKKIEVEPLRLLAQHLLLSRRFPRPIRPDREINTQQTANAHCCNLKSNTRHNHLVADVYKVRCFGGSRTTAGGLHEDGDEIAGDENPGVVFGWQAGVFGTEV